MKTLKVLCLSLVLGTAACSSLPIPDESGQDMTGQSGVYTLVNLHPDSLRARLYAANFLQSGLIPLCTEVTIVKAKKKAMTFTDNTTGQTYTYYYHKAAGQPFAEHLQGVFGKRCNKDAVAKLSTLDRQGIADGVALVGMSKQGVTYALGQPPRNATPSPSTSNIWKYWKSRFDTMNVEFGPDGKVSKIVN